MPAYDFKCQDCKRKVVLTFKTYAEYDTAEKRCPNCNSMRIVRTIKRVGIAKSELTRFANDGDDVNDDVLDDLADADPRTLGRYMRRMSDETGEDLGQEFNEVVSRLERGEDPEAIEASMALPDEDMGMGGDSEGIADGIASSMGDID